MDASHRAPGYDLFKSIVAILLFLLLIYLLLGVSHQVIGAPTQIPTIGSLFPTSIPSQTLPPPPTSTLEIVPSATATLMPTPLPPSATETPQPENPTPSPAPAPVTPPSPEQSQTHQCSDLNPSRLQPGMKASTLVRLNLRSSPGIHDNWILTMPINTQVEITGEPTCTVYANGSYLWWPVKLANGQTGWSAEASQWREKYFLAPSQ